MGACTEKTADWKRRKHASRGSKPAHSNVAGDNISNGRLGCRDHCESSHRISRHPRPRARDANAQAITLDTINVQSDSGRTDGYLAHSTSVATKTNTPLLNIPQSITVVTKDFIKDQSFPGLTDVTRYVPGVAVHQGEGNRDELVIRGVDSSANFFVNGFRDDVQYFRDLYNAQSVEILKGPSALTFGRGAGGGLLNRTLKEADWHEDLRGDRTDRIVL